MSIMVVTNKDAKALEREMEKLKNKEIDPYYDAGPFAHDLEHHPGERRPNDLEQRIEDLMKVNLAHHNINADLNKEVKYQTDQARFYKIQVEQLKKENQELRNKQTEFIKQFRNKGDM